MNSIIKFIFILAAAGYLVGLTHVGTEIGNYGFIAGVALHIIAFQVQRYTNKLEAK